MSKASDVCMVGPRGLWIDIGVKCCLSTQSVMQLGHSGTVVWKMYWDIALIKQIAEILESDGAGPS